MLKDIHWCLSTTNLAHWAQWDDCDEAVIYIESTGETTLVSLICFTLLDLISWQPQTLTSLKTHISNLMDEPVEEQEILTAVNKSLTQLRQLGIINPCP